MCNYYEVLPDRMLYKLHGRLPPQSGTPSGRRRRQLQVVEDCEAHRHQPLQFNIMQP